MTYSDVIALVCVLALAATMAVLTMLAAAEGLPW